MNIYLRGALIEYGSDFMGPIPNVVIFQFNPENLSRSIQIPPRPTGNSGRESNQAGELPIEKITLTAQFNASDRLAVKDPLARLFGIGPQLAALEQMANPKTLLSGAIGEALDSIGDALGLGGDDAPTRATPRENYPRLLFIWGLTRVLPVIIESMSITEQQYDNLLNPIRAEVSLGLAVSAGEVCPPDDIAEGALTYSNLAKEAQAMVNLVNTVRQAVEMIAF